MYSYKIIKQTEGRDDFGERFYMCYVFFNNLLIRFRPFFQKEQAIDWCEKECSRERHFVYGIEDYAISEGNVSHSSNHWV